MIASEFSVFSTQEMDTMKNATLECMELSKKLNQIIEQQKALNKSYNTNKEQIEAYNRNKEKPRIDFLYVIHEMVSKIHYLIIAIIVSVVLHYFSILLSNILFWGAIVFYIGFSIYSAVDMFKYQKKQHEKSKYFKMDGALSNEKNIVTQAQNLNAKKEELINELENKLPTFIKTLYEHHYHDFFSLRDYSHLLGMIKKYSGKYDFNFNAWFVDYQNDKSNKILRDMNRVAIEQNERNNQIKQEELKELAKQTKAVEELAKQQEKLVDLQKEDMHREQLDRIRKQWQE